MFKHRFFAYIITASVLVILAISFVGVRAYIRQNEVKATAEVLDNHNHNHTNAHDEYDQNRWPAKSSSKGNQFEFDAKLRSEDEKRQLELEEWHKGGKLTPRVEAHLKMLESRVWQSENAIVTDVIQRIVTPDGTLHQVIVPKHRQYEEGDAILKSEIVDEKHLRSRYRSEGETYQEMPRDTKIVAPNNVTYPMPDEYYDIEDPHEQLKYTTKFVHSLELGISMDEVEQMVASGELDVSLRESEKRMVDETETMIERGLLEHQLHMLSRPKRPPLSDKPPVKVSFLSDEGKGAKRGWMRKAPQKQDGAGDIVQSQPTEHERGIDNTRSASSGLPSENHEQQRITPSKQAMADFLTSSPENLEAHIKAQFSPEERMKTSFNEKLSPERKGQLPPILTRDDPEEELRRLREADSEGSKPPEQHDDHDEPPPPSR